MTDDELAALIDEDRWRRQMSEATDAAREWCERFLAGETLSKTATIAERRGWLLASQAPARLRTGD